MNSSAADLSSSHRFGNGSVRCGATRQDCSVFATSEPVTIAVTFGALLFGAALQRSSERQRWLRDTRYRAYVEFTALASSVAERSDAHVAAMHRALASASADSLEWMSHEISQLGGEAAKLRSAVWALRLTVNDREFAEAMRLVVAAEFLPGYYEGEGVIEYYIPPDKWLTPETVDEFAASARRRLVRQRLLQLSKRPAGER
jgi:hypothetical protein